MKRLNSMSAARRVTGTVALLGALAVVVFYAATALAGGSLAAPTITAEPANPTNSQTATFTYKDTSSITSFQCSLDGVAFAACGTANPSTKIYTGLLAGSHTFKVEAVSGTKTSSATSYTWVIDLTPPTVTSIKTAAANPTNVSSVTWTVVFSESVTGVASGDFSLVKTVLGGTPAVTGVSGSGTTYTVTASTGTGSGTLGLNLANAGSIKDTAGNTLGGTIPFVGQTYTIDRTAPTVVSITCACSSSSPTNASSVTWTVTFSESVTGVTKSNFATTESGLTGSTSVTAVSGSGTTWTVTASAGTSGSGTLQLKLSSGSGIKDLAGNALGGTIPFNGQTCTIDRTRPTVVSINLAGPNPTSASSVTWTVLFSESVTGVATSDFGLVATGLSGTSIAGVSGSGTTYTVTASTGTGSGTLQLKLSNAGSIKDLAGNGLGGTIPFYGQTYTIQAPQPFTIAGNAVSTLYPGVSSQIDLIFGNPNNVAITVTAVTASVSIAPCGTGNFSIVQQLVLPVNPIVVPANMTMSLMQLGVPTPDWPRIEMIDTGINQDSCENTTVTLSYTGSAHS